MKRISIVSLALLSVCCVIGTTTFAEDPAAAERTDLSAPTAEELRKLVKLLEQQRVRVESLEKEVRQLQSRETERSAEQFQNASTVTEKREANSDVSLESYDLLLRRVDELSAERIQNFSAAAQPSNVYPFVPHCGGWFVKMESVLLKPSFSSNTAMVIQDTDLLGAPETSHTNEFKSNLTYSPRFEIGFAPQSEGWGFRTRLWHFEHDTSQFVRGDIEVNFADDPDIAIDDNNNNGISAYQRTEALVFDLEASTRTELWNMSILGGGGIRILDLEHEGQWSDQVDTGERATLFNEFRGAGPTLFMEVSRPVTTSGWMSDMSLFAKTRGSLLVGEQNFFIGSGNNASVEPVYRDLLIVSSENTLLPVVELQLGTSYTREMGAVLMELGVAWESQLWLNSGVAAANEGAGKDSDDFQVQRTADMLLQGVNFSIMFTR